jgi:hypothetical protein
MNTDSFKLGLRTHNNNKTVFISASTQTPTYYSVGLKMAKSTDPGLKSTKTGQLRPKIGMKAMRKLTPTTTMKVRKSESERVSE